MRFWLVSFLVGLIVLGAAVPTAAQVDNLPVIPYVQMPSLPQSEEELPSREELRVLGLSEEEIDQIYELYGQADEPTDLELYLQNQQANEQPPAEEISGSGETVTGLEEGAVVPAESETTTEETTTATDVNATDFAAQPARIYGQQFFRNNNLEVFDATNVKKVPDNYIIGPGDELTISAYGFADYNQVFTVNDDGYIYPKEAGRIYLKGLPMSDARVLLRNRFGRFIDLRRSQFDVTVNYSPAIRVNIVGEVNQPGSYTISSFNTAFNALTLAAGTSDLGSVRRIEIRRDGQTIKILDLYKFLMDPASNQDFFLEDNDYIVVPSYRKAVAIQGEIKREHTYELLDYENMNMLLEYSGGLNPRAYTKNVQIKRFDRSQQNLIDINLDSLMTYGGDYELFDGDTVIIATIPARLENYVEVKGAVNFPGQYELRPGTRIKDILDKAKGAAPDALLDRAYLIRLDEDYSSTYIPIDVQAIMDNPSVEDNLLLEKFDVIEIFSKEDFRENLAVVIDGAVRSPGEFTFAKGMTLKDLLYHAGGLKLEAANNRIEVSRIVEYDPSKDIYKPTRTVIETVSIGSDLAIDDVAADFMLQPYDRVEIYVSEDFNIHQNVAIAGEVQFPGTYTLTRKDERLTDIIDRAGGLNAASFLQGATLYRGKDDLGSVILDLEKAIKNPESSYNLILEDGDMITVPKLRNYIEIAGAVNYPGLDTIGQISAPFEKKRAGYYVNNYAGGFDPEAKPRLTYVMAPNGQIKRTKEILWINIYPKVDVGDQVVAVLKPDPQRPTLDNVPKKPFDWNLFASATSAAVLSFATILVLIDRNK